MTAALAPGTLIIDPADVSLVRWLVREGVCSVRARGAIPTQVRELVEVLDEAAALAAGSARGTVAVPAPPAPAGSPVTVRQAAEVLVVSEAYVRRLCRLGQLGAVRHGTSWAVDADSLTALRLHREAS